MVRRVAGIVFSAGVLIGIAWWAVQSARIAPQPDTAPEAVEANLPPAPYPDDFSARLARVSGLRIVQAGMEELPTDLPWQTGEGEEALGDPRAVRGGVVRLSSPGPFPDNLLAFGSPTPQFLHANVFERVELLLVEQHPVSRRIIPGVAEAWAVRGRTVYFRLHPEARYSNGRPVRAGDYALGAVLREAVGDAGWKALCREAEELTVYGDRAVALTLRRAGPLMELRAAKLLHAAEPGFYRDALTAAAADAYAEVYAWKVPPTTGAYSISRMEKGRLVVLRRVRHWWAENLPLRRHTCNVDAVEFHFLTDEAQTWEFLLRGKLDMVQTRNVASWHRYADTPRLMRLEYNAGNVPQPPYGIALNARKIPDVAVRRGLLAAMDMERAIAILFRGEGRRLRSFFDGYGLVPPQEPVCYDPAAARDFFAQAGYTQAGEDGILRREDGRRLSFCLSYVPSEKVSTLVEVLRESARASGAEIVPEALSWQACAQQVRDGEHEMTFWATVPTEPLPEPARYFSSSAQGDEAPFCLADADMDAALAELAGAGEMNTFAAALGKVDTLIRKLAIWLPGWSEDRVRVLHSPRLHFPQQPGRYYDVADNPTFWCKTNYH